MAETNIVGGLFGMTPEALQAQQFQQQQDQALLMAKMSPFERANYGMSLAGSQLGSAIPKMFGYQDPQMVKASTIQQLSQEANLDLSNPDSFKTLSSKLAQAGYLNEANMAAQKAREIEAAISKLTLETAQAKKANREADPIFELAKTGKFDPASLALFKQTGNYTDLVPVEKLNPTEIQRLQDYRDLLIENNPKDPKIAEVNAVIKGASEGKGTKIYNELKMPADINSLAAGVEGAVKDEKAVFETAKSAKGLINMASKSNNPTAWESARTQIAKAVGESKLSNEDIARTGVNPAIIPGLKDWINKKVEGVPTVETQQALYAVASFLEKNAEARINEKMAVRRELAKSQNMKVNENVVFPMAGQKKNTVKFNDLTQ